MESRKLLGFHHLHLLFQITVLILSSVPTSVHAQYFLSSVSLPDKLKNSDIFSYFLASNATLNSSSTLMYNLFGFYTLYTEPLTSVLGVYTRPDLFVFNEGPMSGISFAIDESVLVWSANRDRAVGQNATVEFTKDGDLVLRDADGSFVWSTNTSGKSVVRMNLTEFGNLVLLDAMNRIVWQSFDHPTNVLRPGQNLMEGQRLTADASASNVSTGQFYLSLTPSGFLQAFVDSNPPQLYGKIDITDITTWFSISSEIVKNKFLRLDHDGHLRMYFYGIGGWSLLDTFSDRFSLTNDNGCGVPTVCGKYGICHGQGLCKCLPFHSSSNSTYFVPVNETFPALGCTSPLTPLYCPNSHEHRLLTLQNVGYFSLSVDSTDDPLRFPEYTTPERCKEECLRNCSCKAAIFRYSSNNASHGVCYMPNQVFSFFQNVPNQTGYNSTTYLKIKVPPTSDTSGGTSSTNVIVGVLCSLVGILLIGLGLGIVAYRRKRSKGEEDDEEDDDHNIPEFPNMPKKFTYELLKFATANFSMKLGGGGFGSVFDGTLLDGVRIAVKKLESINQGKKEFVAEVNTIGSIHHLNLVKLVGFCVEKSHRLLVYEHMVNGSLDRWIFGREEGSRLDWATRRRIIDDVAKGLLYLHEECRQKIAHLDIKPENILLDSNFNAKVSDFGLAKLMDRDQSVVQTKMRGTPGYLAPEWLTSFLITEKVDVYSFGVVIAEIVCGRRNLDYQQTLLLTLLKESGMSGQLSDIFDGFLMENATSDDGVVDQMEGMLKMAIWCLQNDPRKRPSMSMAVHVLEGKMEIPQDLGYDFTTAVEMENIVDATASEPCSAFELSGPR